MSEEMPVWTRIKPVTAETSDVLGGDKVLAAVTTRITQSARFSEYASFKHPNRVVALDAAIEVDRHAMGRGLEPLHAQLVASELGMMLVRRPQFADSGSRLARVTAQALKETSDVFSALAEVMADEKVTAEELPNLEKQIDEALALLEAVRHQARAEAERASDA